MSHTCILRSSRRWRTTPCSRNLAVIGEAVRSLPSETRDAMPDVPWPAIAGLRNIVVPEWVNPDLILDIRRPATRTVG